MDAAARVCPFCGEPPGDGVFCAACGRNLGQVEQLPTRGEWEGSGTTDRSPQPSAGDLVVSFLAAMHAAGDPGAARMPRAEPGFLGRTQHARGWVVRPAEHGDDERQGRAGLFLAVDGGLHRLDSTTQGVSFRGPVYTEVVGPVIDAAPDDPRLAGDLAAVLRANGIDAGPPAS